MTDALVCEELGVSTRQLRRWKDAVREHGEEEAFPGHGKARDNEVAKLRRKGIFYEKRQGTSPRSRSEIRLYPSTSPPALHQDDVSTARGLPEWLLRLEFSRRERTIATQP